MGLGTKSVYLGNDTTLDAKYGDSGTEKTGIDATWLHSEYDTYDNEMEAISLTSGGYGSATAWAYLGRAFTVEDDSGSEWATISASSYMRGEMNVAFDGTNYGKIELIVKDETEDEVYDDLLFEKGDYINNDIDRTVRGSVNVDLEAGHTYGVQIETTAEITVDGDAEEASTDFSREDDGDDRTTWEEVKISF